MTNIPHEHDDDGNCIPPENGFYAQALPTWRFSIWDLAGIALVGVANVLGVTGNAVGLLSRECAAMANWKRSQYDERQARRANEAHQRAIGADLRALIEGEQS